MGPSWLQILIVLGIVILIFGTKKLRNIGGDLGGAIKGFKSAMKDGEAETRKVEDKEGRIIDGEARVEDKDKADKA